MQTYVLADGCFWCLDAVYRTLDGVTAVVSGHTGGHTVFPSYESVCTEQTGHAEAVAVTFDEAVIPSDVILDVFFTLHDPRQLDRQGYDVGSQYRSEMFYSDAEQKVQFEAAHARAEGYWGGGLVTRISALGEYYVAEKYHQDFFAKNPGQGYCVAIALPKVRRVRKEFAQYILAS